ncbi:MAG: Type III restriction-modification enzyme helicase subunit [Candidatus Jettenia ecosi]|uniref:Type III restriction-modification enzyme helicase subunit n=1 Tax=Candidatus Jettenia ecosi TaxID=2494326 RepID=A0A533QEJ6_9BACT|nr:MAG: Type III restriction-modification enzyme helicase subunit [Candidatus Jettenia ecosi]
MNRIAMAIKNRLSLRPPQADSLNILAELTDKLILKKHTPNPISRGEYKSPLPGGDSSVGSFLQQELEKVKTSYPTCTDFERNFPSICFSLATGVGKTRLMGAFVAYLYLSKGIRNFFVLAPNITIHNKLIEDFSNPISPKYVFQGIGEFVHKQPRIITGDNYNTLPQTSFLESDVHINVFNISKINAETKGDKLPRIKRLSEYLGDSYFNYLANLDDLVLLMDESHHYRADRGMQVINELNPVLGLEVTATPQVERSGSTIKFKNVVYEYSLAKAIQDGFVKEPAVATRKDFNPAQYSNEELDRIKLEDGIRIHEDTKVALDIYARNNKEKRVKPFVLVVAQHTEHASDLKKLITSNSFFHGDYADKVMEIHSNQSGEEKDENIEKLISLENPENKIEIVVHVNMLKEGWDVTNLYTIIPLRTATSLTLREQTIGRGLRLPYGKRTGNDKVDKLTIVAHDKFQEIIDEANRPNSIIKQQNIIVIDAQELNEQKEVITSVSSIEQKFEEEQKRIHNLTEPESKQKALINLELQKTILSTLPEMSNVVKNVHELTKSEIKQIALEKIKQKMYSSPQKNLFAAEMIKEVEAAYETVVHEFVRNIIEIPRITIQPSNEIKSGFRDFDLDIKSLNYQPVSEEILIKKLREQENGLDILHGIDKGRIIIDKPENLIVNELMNYPEIDYDTQSDLLLKLAQQAAEKFKTYLGDNAYMNVIQYHKNEIGKYIHSQLMQHFYYEAPGYEKPVIKPFTRIEEHNFSKYTKDSIHHFTETITPTSAIPHKVFSGFRKACHGLYKFDSKTEKDFATILEQDKSVLKWMRPAPNQFMIYWKHNSKQYIPDFVAEAVDTIYMVETKKEGDIELTDIKEKAQAAFQYCKYATEYTTKYEGKPWKYILIPHNAVMMNMGFGTLVMKYEYQS